MSESLPYRPNVCLLIINTEGLIFLGERLNQPGVWQFPQGGAEPHLSLEENVYRELFEEVGIGREGVFKLTKLEATHRYDFSAPPSYAIGRWRGQNQTFWLIEYSGDGSDIRLDGEHPEFQSYQWCRLDQVRDIAEPRRLPGYERPLKEVERYIKARSSDKGR